MLRSCVTILGLLAACACASPAPTSNGPATAATDAATDAGSTDSAAPGKDAGGDALAPVDTAGLADAKPDAAVGGDAPVAIDAQKDAAAGIDADAGQADVGEETAPADTDTAALDTAAAETVAPDTAVPDAGVKADGAAVDGVAIDTAPDVAAVCTLGKLARCWIECPQTYTTGCIDGGLNPKIMGTRACVAGQWGKCEVSVACAALNAGPCTNGKNLDVQYTCLAGKQQAGKYICSKALGANCATSWFVNWPLSDCPHFCPQQEVECPTLGAEAPCEILCGGPEGPAILGKQKCQEGCGFKYWSQCWGDKPCAK